MNGIKTGKTAMPQNNEIMKMLYLQRERQTLSKLKNTNDMKKSLLLLVSVLLARNVHVRVDLQSARIRHTKNKKRITR